MQLISGFSYQAVNSTRSRSVSTRMGAKQPIVTFGLKKQQQQAPNNTTTPAQLLSLVLQSITQQPLQTAQNLLVLSRLYANIPRARQTLREQGIDPDNAEQLNAALQNAVTFETGNPQTAISLLACGANPARENENGQNILMQLVSQPIGGSYGEHPCHSEIIPYLVLACPTLDLEAVDNRNRTALMLAAENGQFEAVKMLLEKGAKVHRTNSLNNAITAAIQASSPSIAFRPASRAIDYHARIVETLIEHQNRQGGFSNAEITHLHSLAQEKRHSQIQALVTKCRPGALQ